MPKRGGSRGRKKPSIHHLSRERRTADDLDAFLNELGGSSDRACALLCGAMMDNIIRELLATQMRDDWADLANEIFDGVRAPLSGFAARIKVAYALNLINAETERHLNMIREIRNVFAHSERPITFSHAAISDECKRLPVGQTHIDWPYEENRLHFMNAFLDIYAALFHLTRSRNENRLLAKAITEYKPPSSPEIASKHN